jgi:hypothetical protein
MYRDIVSAIKKHNIDVSGKWLSISSNANIILRNFDVKPTIIFANYPEHDWCDLKLPSSCYGRLLIKAGEF